jgi:hypothetical protein
MDIRTAGAVLSVIGTIYACRILWVYHHDVEEQQHHIEKMKQDEQRRAQKPIQPHNRHHKPAEFVRTSYFYSQ